jgi:hypothetical protein
MSNTCEICGREFNGIFFSAPYNHICNNSECFNEKFWRVKEEAYEAGEPFIIIDGELYFNGGYTESSDKKMIGFGGRRFDIRMNNGKEIMTNNLWYNGKIPENHREKLADNATFIHY